MLMGESMSLKVVHMMMMVVLEVLHIHHSVCWPGSRWLERRGCCSSCYTPRDQVLMIVMDTLKKIFHQIVCCWSHYQLTELKHFICQNISVERNNRLQVLKSGLKTWWRGKVCLLNRSVQSLRLKPVDFICKTLSNKCNCKNFYCASCTNNLRTVNCIPLFDINS